MTPYSVCSPPVELMNHRRRPKGEIIALLTALGGFPGYGDVVGSLKPQALTFITRERGSLLGGDLAEISQFSISHLRA